MSTEIRALGIRRKVAYVRDVERLEGIPPEVRERLAEVAERYPFRANDYYLGLVDWNDPADPIRRLVVPDEGELERFGSLDASGEAKNAVAPGVQHKYPHTVLFLVNEVCGAFCRYCFRKRLFQDDTGETSIDVTPGLRYVAARPQITNVLLTGGDPLMLNTRRLEEIVGGIRAIPHVGIVRIGTKMPAFNPYRILDDPELLAMFRRHSTPEKRIYVMAHFDHPRELTPAAVKAIGQLIEAGAMVVNQCPLIAGINDDPETLAELFRRLSFIGAPQYYLFQGRPTAGNAPFEIPIVRGYFLFEEAKKRVSGLAKRARFVMSHERGKIEVVGVTDTRIYLRFHRARNPAAEGRFLAFYRDDEARWLDDLVPADEASAGDPASDAA
jgi:KamA family protein